MQSSNRSLAMFLSIAIIGTACLPATVADGCFELAEVVCAKLSSCDALGDGSVGECRSENTAACCRNYDDCGRPPKPAGVESLRRCEAAIRAMSCGQVTGNLVPTECAP